MDQGAGFGRMLCRRVPLLLHTRDGTAHINPSVNPALCASFAHTQGYPIEMGAQWIHGATGNPLTALAEQFNLSTVPEPALNTTLLSGNVQQPVTVAVRSTSVYITRRASCMTFIIMHAQKGLSHVRRTVSYHEHSISTTTRDLVHGHVVMCCRFNQ